MFNRKFPQNMFSQYVLSCCFSQTLTKLDLNYNQIGAVRAKHLADVLRNNTVSLILSSSISYTHRQVFTQTLTTLDLHERRIGAVGAQHLADALRNNTVTLTLPSSISYTHRHFFHTDTHHTMSRLQSNRSCRSTTSR
jgi:hypothetical protein